MRFAIKNTEDKAQRESGGEIIRFSGTAEPFNRVSERECRKIADDQNGKPIFQYTTGLDEKRIKYLSWFTDDEKTQVVKQIEELKPVIEEFYGADILNDKNTAFWGESREVSRLALSHETVDVFFYDTKNPVHALLYLSILAGAFVDLVAPNKDYALANYIPHYMQLETDEAVFEGDDEITKSDAHAKLGELRKNSDPESLIILAWCLQYETSDFAAYTRTMPLRDLIAYHIKYINGQMQAKNKRNAAKAFIEYATKWEKPQTRPLLYAEAYIKAGEYFNFLTNKEKRFTTQDGIALGNNISEALENIMKPKFSAELEKLRDQVENKWKE